MAYQISDDCISCGVCASNCPVGAISEGDGKFVIDADTCIDCGACEAECPFGAIFLDDEVPASYKAKGGEVMTAPAGTSGFTEVYDGQDHDGNPVHLESTRTLKAGEVVDLTPAVKKNADFFSTGPGYNVK